MSPNLIPYICPVCVKDPSTYYGHLQKPGTVEFCVNHVTRDPDTGVISEEKIELVPVVRERTGHPVKFGDLLLGGGTKFWGAEIVDGE